MSRPILVALATLVLGAPAAASAQPSLSVDPAKPCYRETEEVQLLGSGFTPNAPVNFTRAGSMIGPPIPADASGALTGKLKLPGLVSGQRRLTYVATDTANPALVAQTSLLLTATDVSISPQEGISNAPLRIRGRGFFGGRRVWAHVVRTRRPARTARTRAIGPVKGACRTVKAKRRLFPNSVAPGEYLVQFDTFRRYRPKRTIESEFVITVSRPERARS